MHMANWPKDVSMYRHRYRIVRGFSMIWNAIATRSSLCHFQPRTDFYFILTILLPAYYEMIREKKGRCKTGRYTWFTYYICCAVLHPSLSAGLCALYCQWIYYTSRRHWWILLCMQNKAAVILMVRQGDAYGVTLGHRKSARRWSLCRFMKHIDMHGVAWRLGHSRRRIFRQSPRQPPSKSASLISDEYRYLSR